MLAAAYAPFEETLVAIVSRLRATLQTPVLTDASFVLAATNLCTFLTFLPSIFGDGVAPVVVRALLRNGYVSNEIFGVLVLRVLYSRLPTR